MVGCPSGLFNDVDGARFFAYRCFKKFAYGGMANFLILAICFESDPIHIIETAILVGGEWNVTSTVFDTLLCIFRQFST